AEQSQLDADRVSHDVQDFLTVYSSHMQVFTSSYDGTSWSTPVQLTGSGVANGDLALAANTTSHTARLVWGQGNDPNAFPLMTSSFAESSGTWTTPSTLVTTPGLGARHVALTSRAGGGFTLAYVAGPPVAGKLQLMTISS